MALTSFVVLTLATTSVASKPSLRGGDPGDWQYCLHSVPHTTVDSPGVMEEHAEFKVLQPGEYPYDKAFWNVSVDPADMFGDKGCREPDLGGMKNWEIVEVVKPLKLYGAKFLDSYDDYWFADDLAINQSLIGYSNNGMLTCWDFTKWMECTVKPGIALIAGEGASRDTCKTMQGGFPCNYLPDKCDFDNCSNMGTEECPIVQHQKPPAKILQYIVKPAAWKMECHVCDLYAPNLKESCTRSVPEPIDLPEPIEPFTGSTTVGGGRRVVR